MNNAAINYSMLVHNFVSPLRGATSAAVPHNKRDMSSSPYMHKKRSEVSSHSIHFECMNNRNKDLLQRVEYNTVSSARMS